MVRRHIAPDYVNIEMAVVMSNEISSAAKQTYMNLKALACGKKDVTFSVNEYLEIFGAKMQTMYRHLSLLATCAVLRYGSPGNRTTGLMHVEFLLSQKREIPKNENSLISNTVSDTLIEADEEFPFDTKVLVVEGGEGGFPKNGNFPKVRSRGSICQGIITSLTGWVTYPAKWDKDAVQEVIWGYYQENNEDEQATADALRVYFDAWRSRRTQDNRRYNVSNSEWLLTWAATRTIPETEHDAQENSRSSYVTGKYADLLE